LFRTRETHSIFFQKCAHYNALNSLNALHAVIGCKLKQNANEGCNSCASLAGLVLSFIAGFILIVIIIIIIIKFFNVA